MRDDDSNLVDDFNPVLDDDGDDAFEGFDELLDEHSKATHAKAEVREAAKVDEELSFGGFKERLPEPVVVPSDVKSNSDVSRSFREKASERRVERDVKAAKLRGGSSKESSGGSESKPRFVDEEIEQSKPVFDVVKPRVRGGSEESTGNVANGEGAGSDSSGDDSLTPGEKWSGVKKDRRYRYVGDSGLLNGAELEFFRVNETSRRAVLSGDDSLNYLRPPVGSDEDDEARLKRVERVTRAVFGRDAYARNSKKKWSRKHQEMLEFLAKFKYANARHLSKMFSESPATSLKRLKALRSYGLVIDKKLLGGEPLWFLTDAGMLISGFDLPKVTESRITYTMLPHQYAVNHIAANLWGAGINILNEEDYPRKNRVDLLGKEQYGDYVVSEQEIQSSFGKLKLFSKADVYLPTLKASIDRKVDQWREAGGVDFGPSPEFQLGNEYMWAIYPPSVVKLAYHVPDLVVARPRNSDGTPNSVAVELEIQNKPVESYRKALTAYRYSSHTFKQVVWVCQKASSAKKIRDLAKELGMLQDGSLRVVPIITSDGVFKGRDLWTL